MPVRRGCGGKLLTAKDVIGKFPSISHIGKYHVGRKINEGAFGKVMEGVNTATRQKVAIKIMDKRNISPKGLINLKREMQINRMVHHQNIVRLHEILETREACFFIMDLCPGGNLLEKMYEGPLTEQQVIKYTRQILSAVEHLHQQGIVHRDIKLENILLDANDDIKLVDFGLSNIIQYFGLQPQPLRTTCGTFHYEAPEVLESKPYTAKVDMWSIGVSVYEMLMGHFPFDANPKNIRFILGCMHNREIMFPPELSEGAKNFIKRLLQPDPAKRPTAKMAQTIKWLAQSSAPKIKETTV